MKCSVCSSNISNSVVDFNKIPLCDNLAETKEEANKVPTFKVEIKVCQFCGHSELTEKAPEEIIYSNYIYRTSSSPTLEKHFFEYSNYLFNLIKETNNNKNFSFLDIGGNDGTLAKFMLEKGFKSFVIDPSPAIKFCPSGIITINNYLNLELAKTIKDEHGPFKFISTNNCMANIRDLHSFAKSISFLLEDNGILVVETGYIKNQLSSKTAEMLNHEHYHYFSINSLNFLFKQYGIRFFDSIENNNKGGSIRYIGKKTNKDLDKKEKFKLKKEVPLSNSNEIKNFHEYYTNRIIYLQNLIKDKNVVGFGASGGTTILAYVLQLQNNIEFIFDDNNTRHGLFMPGFLSEVKHPNYWYKNPGDICLNFAWRYGEMIRSKHLKNLPINYQIIDVID